VSLPFTYGSAAETDYCIPNPEDAPRMNRLLPCIALGILAVMPAFADQAAWPDLFRRAFSAEPAVQLYAYDFLDERDGDRPGFTRGRIDPSKPEGERVTIYEATGDKVDLKKIDKRYERNADGDIWCDELSGGPDGPVSDKGASADGRLFAFTPLPKPDAEDGEKKLYRQLAAMVAIDERTAQIRTFTATLTAPWKPMVLAKLDAVEMTGNCAPAPNGRAFSARMKMRIAGSALGNDFKQDVTHSISNLTPVGSP